MFVHELRAGDVVEVADQFGIFIGRSDHRTYEGLQCVIWRLSNGLISIDALSLYQDVGPIVSSPEAWAERVAAAMGDK